MRPFLQDLCRKFFEAAQELMPKTLQKTVRVTQEQWDRVQNAARSRSVTPNQLHVELAMEALERTEWPRTEAEMHLLRSAMFSAQAIARDMTREGRKMRLKKFDEASPMNSRKWLRTPDLSSRN